MIGKLKHKSTKRLSTGITVSERTEIEIMGYFHHDRANDILNFLMLFFSVYGTVFSFIKAFQIPVYDIWMSISVFSFTSIFYLLCTLKTHKRPIAPFVFMLGAVAVICGIAYYKYRDRITEGFYLIENIVIDKLNQYYNLSILPFIAVKEEQIAMISALMTFIIAVLAFVLLLSVFILKSRMLYLIITGLFVFSALGVGLVPPILYFIIYAMGTGGVLFSFPAKEKGKVMNHQEMRIASNTGKLMMLGVGLLSFLYILMFSKESYQKTVHVEELKTSLTETFAQISKMEVKKILKLENSAKASGGLSGGKLGRVDEIEFLNGTAIRVTMQPSISAIYLKGYTGSVYNKTEWRDLRDSDEQKLQELESELKKYGFQPETQTGDFITYGNSGNFLCFDYELSKVVVENLTANTNYEYIPYRYYSESDNGQEQVSLDSNEQIYEYYTLGSNISSQYVMSTADEKAYVLEQSLTPSRGLNNDIIYSTYYEESYKRFLIDFNKRRTISISEQMESISDEILVTNRNMKRYNKKFLAYLNSERKYRDRVYELYTDVTKGGGEIAIAEFKKFMSEQEPMTINDLSDRISEFLSSRTEYSLSPGRLPRGKDFVDYFVMENGKGYCSHYASAAVLLLRSMGIPARYAEGYVVTQEDMSTSSILSMKVKREYGIRPKEFYIRKAIKDTNAHAWAEIYIDNFGWMPMEFTPAYRNNAFGIPKVIKDEALRQQEVRSRLNHNSSFYSSQMRDNETKKKDYENEDYGNESRGNSSEEGKKPNSSASTVSAGKGSGSQIVPAGSKLLKKVINLLKFLLAFLIISSLTLAILCIRLNYRNYKLMEVLSDEDLAKRVLYLYEILMKYLNHYKLPKTEELSYDSYAHMVEGKLNFIEQDEFKSVLYIALKAKFGNSEVDDSEFIKVYEFYSKVRMHIYRWQSNSTKFYFKYIRGY